MIGLLDRQTHIPIIVEQSLNKIFVTIKRYAIDWSASPIYVCYIMK